MQFFKSLVNAFSEKGLDTFLLASFKLHTVAISQLVMLGAVFVRCEPAMGVWEYVGIR